MFVDVQLALMHKFLEVRQKNANFQISGEKNSWKESHNRIRGNPRSVCNLVVRTYRQPSGREVTFNPGWMWGRNRAPADETRKSRRT